jgi:spermidine synthase
MKKKVSAKPNSKVQKTQRKLPDWLYLLVAFIEGSAVIAVELLGAKMLSPYYGNSLPVWTCVIGVTVGFLTLGYFIGGRLAVNKNLPRILSWALLLAAVFVIIMPAWVQQLFLLAKDMSLYFGCTLVAILLLGPPLLCLGSTSPLIIQHLTQRVQHAGRSAGKVYAISTIGGIIFTFFLGFVIIPNFGISQPMLFFAILLLIISVIMYFEKKQIAVITLLLVLLVISIGGNISGNKKGFFSILYNSEGMLGQLKVLEQANVPTENLNRYLLINGFAHTNMINIASLNMGYSGWMYVHKIAILASLKHDCKNVLLLGFGGGMIATELQHLNMKVDAVDIDGRMLDIAKKYFYYNDPALTYIVDDARHYLRTANKKYDLIVFDVLNGDVQPSYIFTMESMAEIKNLLTADGMMLVEFQEDKKDEGYYVYQSICNTMLAAGFKAYYNVSDDIVLTGSLKDIDISRFKMEDLTPCCQAQPWATEYIKNPFTKCEKPFERGLILTDDKPMFDILNAETIKSWRIREINSFSNNLLNSDQRLFK